MWIDQDGTWRVIAPTEPGPIPHTTGGDMVLWISRNQGHSRSKVRQLTRATDRNHTYARRLVNAHPDSYAPWADGDTRKPSESSLYFTDREGTAVWRLPAAMDADSAQPEKLRLPR